MTATAPVIPSDFEQGQVVAVHIGTGTGQPQVDYQAATRPPPPPPKLIRLLHSLCMIQIVAGGTCCVLEVIGLGLSNGDMLFGVGIWAGVFFIMAGMFGLRTASHNNRHVFVTYVGMNIIAGVVAVVGMLMSAVEIKLFFSYSHYHYQPVKGGFHMTICLLELLVNIVHVWFSSASYWASCCAYCLQVARDSNREYNGSSSKTANVPATVVLQQPGQVVALNAAPVQMQHQLVANPAFFVNAGTNTSAVPLPIKFQSSSAVEDGNTSGQDPESPPPSYSETE